MKRTVKTFIGLEDGIVRAILVEEDGVWWNVQMVKERATCSVPCTVTYDDGRKPKRKAKP